MKKQLWFFLFFILPATAVFPKADLSSLAKIPILHEGRIKPLDTFAEVNLLLCYGRRSLPDKSAMEWLAELIMNPLSAYKQEIFTIKNPDVVSSLDLPRRAGGHYSFLEVIGALKNMGQTIEALHQLDKEERSPTQNQLVNLYFTVLQYFEISRSLALVLPEFVVSESLAKSLNLKQGGTYTYLQLWPISKTLADRAEKVRAQTSRKPEKIDMELLVLFSKFHQTQVASSILRIIPPQWGQGAEEWVSPWVSLESGTGSPKSFEFVEAWQSLVTAYLSKSDLAWKASAQNLAATGSTLTSPHANETSIHLEYYYNQLKLLDKSLVCYLSVFLLLIASMLFWKGVFVKISFFIFGAGALFHLGGIIMRIAILGRPPVSTLYESIIFVTFITVVFSLVLEWRLKNSVGLIIGSVAGSILLLIAQGYSDDEDTMRMLVAVLNTNFWLATHVITITIGYGCCLVGGVVGHIYLIRKIINPKNQAVLSQLFRNMVGISLVALFFSLFGTILGGIWADQSWGRFWGWDPKENGALLIVLWLLWLLHSRLTNLISGTGYAIGMVITNIIVSLAWFGVNLLNVGLHSYGFTDSIALNLGLFVGGEILFILVTMMWGKRVSTNI